MKILPTDGDIWAFLRTFRGTIRKMVPFRGQMLELWGNILSPLKLAPLVDSDFDVGYESPRADDIEGR